MEVGWVVLAVFEFVDGFLEPLVRVLLVEGDARAEHIDQRESGKPNAALVQLGEMLRVAAESARDVATAHRQCQR